ncbi:MAG TPA: hypothetical protein VJ227_03080 [Patescibacteria group bacterium]|nr:hypothetical protein [Patescibacteria group bacterium]
MLAIKSWRIYYADGSTFSSEDGTWAEAPAFGVECVVYYHVPPYRTGDQNDEGIFIYKGKGDYKDIKMGLWRDAKGHYRIVKAAMKDKPPRWLPEVEEDK